MKKKLTFFVITFAMTFGFFGFFQVLQPASANAQLFSDAKNEACKGAQLGSTTGECNTAAPGNRLAAVLKTALNILSVIIGVAAVIMVIIGGFRFITSGGDSNKVGSAKSTILYAIIGLIIVALAQFIVRFVLGTTRSVVTPPTT